MLRKTIPVLTHVDNLNDMKIDMSAQEQSLQQISNNTTITNSKLDDIISGQSKDFNQQSYINANTTYLQKSVGLPEDTIRHNTVIGLLKSISNKL